MQDANKKLKTKTKIENRSKKKTKQNKQKKTSRATKQQTDQTGNTQPKTILTEVEW